jgi:anti-sigma factor RsiW
VSVEDLVTAGSGCDAVRVTGYVDGALPAAERLEVEAHLAGCEPCRAQAAAERALVDAVRGLPHPTLPHGLAARVRRRSRKPVALRRRVWVPALAALLAVALLGHNAAPFVAWQLALDHAHCFGKGNVPAEVLTDDPMRLSAWFEVHETELPLVPASAGGLDLVGGRFCRLLDRRVVHVYYGGAEHQLSLFVVPGTVRMDRRMVTTSRGATVALLPVAGEIVALVSNDARTVDAFRRSLERTTADGGEAVTRPPALW